MDDDVEAVERVVGLGGVAAQVAADTIRRTMWEHAGVARSADGLERCLATLARLASRLPPGATEELNMVQTAHLIAESALLRRESRGGHYRSDFPKASRLWQDTHIEW